jgi:predicted RNase H-like HicB family nuclease
VRKTGEEEFKENGVAIAKLSEYWQWSASDLLGNTERGRLAEYIVATAVGVAGGVRSGWEPYDVETLLGTRVEVKASAYVQTWGQKTLSKIIATGTTIEATEREIREAIEFHLRGLREDGLPIPEPSSRVDYVEVAA